MLKTPYTYKYKNKFNKFIFWQKCIYNVKLFLVKVYWKLYFIKHRVYLMTLLNEYINKKLSAFELESELGIKDNKSRQ